MTISYSTKSLDHLRLVSGMCKDIGIAKFIDDAHPEQSQDKHVSYGQLVEAVILNGLGFVGRTLHMCPEYFADRPVELLIGKGVKAEHINDDALGRCLDQLYETGVSELFQGLSSRTISHLNLPCEGLNLDSTSIHVDGEYKDEDGNTAIQLVRGYSRDHRYFIADAALYTAETIQSLDEQNQLFISRAPQKLTLVKAAISEQNNYHFTELENGYSATWVDSNYGGRGINALPKGVSNSS